MEIIEPIITDIRIQTTTMCNAHCICCPHKTVYAGNYHIMNDNIWNKCVTQCESLKTLTVVCFGLQYEPFTDPLLFDRIQELYKRTQVSIVVITNATLIRPPDIQKILDSKISYFVVSLYTLDPDDYARITGGLDINKPLWVIDELIKNGKPVTINVTRSETTNMSMFYKRWPQINKEQVFLKHSWCDSRGGTFPFEQFNAKGRHSVFKQGNYCTQPFYSFNILHDGRIPLCCQDWQRESYCGTIEESSIHDILNNTSMKKAREQLLQKIPPYTMCTFCFKEFGYI